MKALLIGYVWPEPESSAAGVRTVHVLRALRDGGFETHFATAADDLAAPGGKREAISPRLKGEGVHTHSIRLNDPSFDEWIKRLDPQVVIFDRFVIEEQFGARVRAMVPRAVRIIDTQDLHFLRREREALLKGKTADDSRLRELAAILRSDHAWLVSGVEAEALRSLGVPSGKFSVTPLSVDLATVHQSATPILEDRAGFVFVGNFRHPPNEDAVLALSEGLWASIRAELPEAELTLIGAYPTPRVESLVRGMPGVKLLGWEKNLREALGRHRVLLAPLRFGAGMKGKILEAWASGTPVVTTPIGIEGFSDSFPGLISTDPREIVAFYRDFTALRRCQREGFLALEKSHDAGINGKAIERQVKGFLTQAESLRDEDWLGQILWREQFRSTEFFSRWLQAKAELQKPSRSSSSGSDS